MQRKNTKNIFLLIVLLTFTAACKKGDSDDSQPSVPDTTTELVTDVSAPSVTPDAPTPTPPADNTSSVPTQAETFEVNITMINFTTTQEAKMLKAVELIKRLVASEEFRTRVLNHSYNSVKTYVDNGGKTNRQIYQHILDGNETLKNVKDNEMDVEVELYYENSTTVGYTYPSSNRIWVNTKYFNTYSIASVAANLMHEWLHKLGYKHATTYSVSRDFSVPYGIGRIVRDIGPKYY
jgi:hypothetical protein